MTSHVHQPGFRPKAGPKVTERRARQILRDLDRPGQPFSVKRAELRELLACWFLVNTRVIDKIPLPPETRPHDTRRP